MNFQDDPFDPVAFYSDDPILQSTVPAPAEVEAVDSAMSISSGTSLRRSVRPKPAAESLISSPPAIKFYESTVVRKSKTTRSKLKVLPTAILKSEDPQPPPSQTTDSKNQILKLRISSSSQSSKENLSEKRNLRVVKLMMPDVAFEDTGVIDDFSKRAGGSTIKFPLLAPKPTTPTTTQTPPLDNATVKERKKRKIKEPSSSTTTTDAAVPLKPKAEIVNEDVCGACGGLGNFICCDSCPRSFHFTCAEPPLDPQNLPEDDWFCCECRHRSSQNSRDRSIQASQAGQSSQISDKPLTSSTIWSSMLFDAAKTNPKCFVMPRRFRYQPKDEDLHKLLTGQLVMRNESSKGSSREPVINSLVNPLNPLTLDPAAHIESYCRHLGEIVVNDNIKLDHCNISAPNISLRKASNGYCHCCGRFGLTKSALLKTVGSEEDTLIPADSRYHRPIISCAICPLYWHLDCLDPPLASFPSSGDISTWTCPIHFTTEKCLALELAESLVQATLLLPESAVRLQFARKMERLRRQSRDESVVDEEEVAFGLGDTINVPEAIKRVY